MPALSATYFAHALKTLYSKDKIANLVNQGRTALAMLKKTENFVGANRVVAMHYGDVARSATEATAFTNKSYVKGAKFTVTRVSDFAPCSISYETIMASQGDAGALMEAVKATVDSGLNKLANSMSIALFRDGSGSIGTVDSPSASTTLTLENSSDVYNFEVGDKIVLAASNAAALRSSGAAGTVSKVNHDSGTLTMAANVTTTWSDAADSDDIFIEGDYDEANDKYKLMGFEGYIPYTAPSASESFFGLDRSVAPNLLAGHRVNGTALQLDEAIVKGAIRAFMTGGRPSHAFMNPTKFEALVNLLGSKVTYTTHKIGEVSFESVAVYGPGGKISVLPDVHCPSNRIFVLQLDDFELCSLGAAPHIVTFDGLQMGRDASAYSFEVRPVFMGNLICKAPGHSAVVAIS